MSATTEQAIARLDTAEYDLVATLAGIPGAGGMREKALEVLEKVRATKRALLARSPEILRKSARSLAAKVAPYGATSPKSRARTEPHWRGLPVDSIAAKTMVAEARSRGLEEQRLSKAAGRTPGDPGETLQVLKQTLRQPITGERALVNFLARGR
jgi:hypothetical protein